MAFNSVDQAWRSYRTNVLNAFPEKALGVLRDAFYAGSVSAVGILIDSPTSVDEVMDELGNYLDLRKIPVEPVNTTIN